MTHHFSWVRSSTLTSRPVPTQRDHQPQTDRRLRGRHRDDEERQDLAALVLQVMAEGRQADVDGIEHDFDRDEHEDDVAPAEEADQTNREEDRAEPQTRAHGHHQGSVFLLGDDDRADDGRQEDEGCDLEGQRELGEQRRSDGRKVRLSSARFGMPAAAERRQPGSCRRSIASAAKATPAAAASGQWAPNRRPRRLARQIEQHEKEQIEHQDGARVDDDLHGRQELRAHEHEDPGDVQEERENPEHAVNRDFCA